MLITNTTGELDWSLKNIRNLPGVSLGYAAEYMKDIDKHPEIYKQKALFLDLVLSMTKEDIADIRKLEKDAGRADSVVDFIAKELENNGTIGALKDGSISDFMSSEAKKEGYVSYSLADSGEYEPTDVTRFRRFGLCGYGRKINLDEETKGLEQRFLIENLMELGYLSKDEGYNIYMNNPVTKNRAFDSRFFMQFLDDDKKSREIFDLYNKAMQKKIDNGQIDPNDLNVPVGSLFLDKVLETGNRDFALKIMRDMAKYLPVGKDSVTVKWWIYEARRPLPFLDIVNDEKRKKLFEQNNLQEEVQKLANSYKKRPGAEFYLNDDYILARARNKLAAKIDERLGTNLEEIKMPLQGVEKNLSKIIKKFKGKSPRE